MPVVVLVTDPATPRLEEAALRRLARHWRGEGPRWLAPGVAAELALPQAPDDLEAVRAELDRGGVDLALLPEAGRRKRILVADMDSTMIRQECIDELAAEAGVGPKVAEITRRAMEGELDFEGALRARVALLAGLPESVITRVLEERITLAPGGRTLVATMKAHGAHTVLVSGGFTAFAEPVAARLGFDEVRANRLISNAGSLTGEVAEPILGRAAKVQALEETAARLGLSPGDAVAVGDGANDLGMIERAGLGVALHAKPVVARAAPVSIRHGNLTALLYLQGYDRDAFAGV